MSFLILECGSAARGDINKHSDRDLVCVWSDTPPDYSSLQKKYGNIMFYSALSIKKMSEKGSLFLTHLDRDSKYLAGDIKLFCSFSGYRPQKSQIKESLINTANFIREIHWHPETLIGKLWLYDVLYVSLRNLVYCKNAMNDNYLFGYEDAIEKLQLTQYTRSIMLLIREGKYSFRSGDFKEPNNLSIKGVEDVCREITGHSVNFLAGGITNWQDIKRQDYWAERLIERAIINGEYNDSVFLNEIKTHNYNKYLIKSHVAKILELKKLPHKSC